MIFRIGDGNGTASAVEVIGLERAVYFLTDKSLTVYILCSDTTRCLAKRHIEFGVGVVGIGRIFLCAKVADSHILGVIGVGMTAVRGQSVCRVIGVRTNTVARHIAVHVIGYSVAVKYNKSVIGVILEAAVGSVGDVSCCIVVEGFGRNHRVIAELLDSSRSYSAEIIISITHFGRICKYLDKKRPPMVSGRKTYWLFM